MVWSLVTPYTLNLISSFRFSIFVMSFIFTGTSILSYFTLFIYFLYFEIRCGWFSSGNRYAKWHHLKQSLAFSFLILINVFLFFNFSGNGRYEEPLSGLYLEMSISCLSTDLITHPLPFWYPLTYSINKFITCIAYYCFYSIFINYSPNVRLEEANIHFVNLLYKSYV